MKTVASFGVAQALALGLCVGLVVSSASCGTKPPIARCNRNTCPDGCCDGDGVCFGTNDAGAQSPQACGIGGVTCQECTSTMTCVMGQCRLATNGGGMGGMGGSGGTGGMAGGTAGAGGGTGGSGGGGITGDGGTCNATTCPSGCCNAAGGCVAPAQQNFTRCGSEGVMCQGCPSGQSCSAKTDGGVGNACGIPNCSACLDTAGNCRTDKMTMTDSNYCGAAGSVCARCDTANGQMCQAGRCVGTSQSCNASNCDGCCAGNTCVRADGGLSNAQCGRNAAACVTCNSPATCDTATGMCMGGGAGGGGGGFPGLDGGGFPTCDPTTCPTGCCSFFSGCVQPGPDPSGFGSNCGTAGMVCQFCIPDCATGMALGFCF